MQGCPTDRSGLFTRQRQQLFDQLDRAVYALVNACDTDIPLSI